MTVFLYEDYVHNNGVLHRALGDALGDVRFCDSADILNGILQAPSDIFVMPGGADLYYCEKLNGAGNSAISEWVRGGGTYFGLCAGAYYACAAIEWGKGTAQEICGPRELAFYPGMATGPVYDYIEDHDIGKSWDGVARIDADGRMLAVYYAGGPTFTGADEHPDVKILGRYADLPGAPAALVECRVGRGRALLCAPHPEYKVDSLGRSHYNHRNTSSPWRQKIARTLADAPDGGPALWRMLMKNLQG